MGRPRSPNPFDDIGQSRLTVAANEALRTTIPYKAKKLPSPSAVEDCTRRVWFIATGHERTEEMPASAVLAAEQGKAQEIIVERILEGMDYVIDVSQYHLTDNEAMSIGCSEGSTDFIVFSKETPDNMIVVDSKRMNIYRYLDLVKSGTRRAHLAYYTQLQLYMKALGLDRSMIIAMSADHSALKGWWRRIFRYPEETMPPPVWVEEIEADPAWQDRSVKRAIDQKRYIDEAPQPEDVPRDFNPHGSKPDWNCNYCGFKKLCMEVR